MKKLMVLFALCSIAVWSQAQGWVHFLNNGTFTVSRVRATNDGGCIATVTDETGPGVFNSVLYKLDQDGTIQWSTILDEPQAGNSFSNLDLSTNNEIGIITYRNDDDELTVRKLNSGSNLIWSKTITNIVSSVGVSDLIFLSNGDLYLLFYTTDNIYTVQRLAINGDLVWEDSFDWPNSSISFTGAIDNADNLLVGGGSFESGNRTAEFRKYSPSGQLLFAVADDTETAHVCGSIVYLENGTFAFTGFKTFVNQSSTFFNSLGYIDINGAISFQDFQTFPPYYDPIDASYLLPHLTSPGDGTIIGSYADSFNGLSAIYKMDANRNYLWDITSTSIFGYNDIHANEFGECFGVGYLVPGDPLVLKLDSAGNVFPNTISGKVFRNEQSNCTPVSVANRIGLSGWQILFIQGQDTLSAITDELGTYSVYADSGDFQVEVIPPNPSLGVCAVPTTFSLTSGDINSEVLDIQAVSLDDCPELDVSIGTPFLRRCFDNTYTARVCNYGSTTSDSALLTIILDPFLEFVSSSTPLSLLDGDTLQFEVEALEIGECVNIPIRVNVSCDAVLGQSHCTEAYLEPVVDCTPPDPLWDGSSILIAESCEADSVRFILENVGSGNMSTTSNYQVIRNLDLFSSGSFQLNINETLTISLPADGSTWRVEADQVEGHPGSNTPIAVLESCSVGGFNTGFLTMFPQNDGNPWIDIDCEENIGSYDPNDKMAEPKGLGPNHFIEANTDLEYKIRFQNTGTDTAFTVVVRDTLPVELNGYSLVMGASSHAYTYDIRNGNVLVVTFNNIMLPDSNVNEPASNGYFKFRIQQQPDLPIGTRIENSAAIYFDFNAPIITNSYFHEIWEGFLTTSTLPILTEIETVEVRIMPNPFRSQTRIEVLGDPYPNLEFWVYNALGQRVDFRNFAGNQLDYQQHHLPKGIYIYEIRSNGKRLQSGKLIKN